MTRAPRGRVRRRRLRREVRVAGYALLILLPLSMALATFAGERRPFHVSSLVIEPPSSPSETIELQAPIALSTVEPIAIAERPLAERSLTERTAERPAAEPPVVLPALLLPVDAPEEPSDGGH